MAKYTVTATRYRRVTKAEDGTKVRTRYFKGDVVDLPEAEAQRLVETGGLVPYVEGQDDPETDAPDTEETMAAKSGSTVEQDQDEYDEMKYAELKEEAKERGLATNGSADDLRARLREDDDEEEEEADEADSDAS